MAEEKYCDLTAPPANAVAVEDHGFYFFIFPNSLTPKFSGCKTWWIDTGQKFMRFRLRDGRVTEMAALSCLPGLCLSEAKTEVCLYADGALATGSPKDCSTFEKAQSFADLGLGTDQTSKVPRAKDIRTKDPL